MSLRVSCPDSTNAPPSASLYGRIAEGSAVMSVDMFDGLPSIREALVSEWLTKFRTPISLLFSVMDVTSIFVSPAHVALP
jgi:hypothetical protein